MSFGGTFGPFVQGPSAGFSRKAAATLTVAAAFVVAALLVFGLAAGLGALAGTPDMAWPWRHGLAAVLLALLAMVDIVSLRRARYCLVGLARQTPRSMMFRYNFLVTAAIWGFDTGLAVTTIRVAALTWAALLLAALGLAPWWIGLGYALGFAVPLVGLICLHPMGRAAMAAGPVDPGLGRLLDMRGPIQVVSAVLLGLAALGLAIEALLGSPSAGV